jgi:hypothetical protein
MSKRKYYKTKAEAEEKRKKGDRIYYDADDGWYLVHKKKSFWDYIIGEV